MERDAELIVRRVLAAVPNDLRAAESLLDAVVSALCLQLVRVQARISASAPVARLPDDVLVQIFTYACRTPPTAPYAATSPTAAALAGTSRRWRTLMLDYPALWTRVDLRHPSGAWALRYSRRLPIHARLDAPLWKDPRDAPLARILAPHLPRLRQLWVQTDASHAERFLHDIAGQTQLERLAITGRYTDEHPIIIPPALLPRLRHLSLTHAHLAPNAPLPENLLTLALKPPRAAPSLPLGSLAALLRASPGLTELALSGGAVPVYKSPGDEDPTARADLARLRSLRVSAVGPVQVAWLLFHITYPASANLALEMELPRALRTAPYDRLRTPHELESYLAALTLFSGEPRERGMPLDTLVIAPAASTSAVSATPGVQSSSPTDKDKHIALHTEMEKLAAQYTTTSATLTLQAGSRATEALVRLVAAGSNAAVAGVTCVSKLVLTGVQIRSVALPGASPGQDGLSQVRTLEIRACSLPAPGASPGAFAVPRQKAKPQTVPPTPHTVPPEPYSDPSTPVQQETTHMPKFAPTHTSQRSQTFNSYTYGPTKASAIPSLPLHMVSAPFATPNVPGAPLSTPNLPGVQLTPNAPPLPTPGINNTTPLPGSPRLFSTSKMPLPNLSIPARVARINPVSTPSTPTQNGPPQTENDIPGVKRSFSGDDTKEGTGESVYGADTTLASAGTGSRVDSSDEDEGGDEKKAPNPSTLVPEGQTEAPKVPDAKPVISHSPLSSDGEHTGEESTEGEEEDETDSNEADGGSEPGDLTLDDEVDTGTITPGSRSVRGRPGTPRLPRSGKTITETGRSTSSVNGGTTPRMSGANTPKTAATGINTPSGTITPNPHLNNIRNGLHSASMTNLRSAVEQHGLSTHAHSISSSNLHAAFKAKGVSQDSRGAGPYPQDAFGSTGPQILRERSTVPVPKQGGFAAYATSTTAATFGTATKPSSSQRPPFSSTAPPHPAFHTFRNPGQTLQTAPYDDDPDSQLLCRLSFHMPALEEIRIVRSTVRGSTLVRFIEARNGAPDNYKYTSDDDDTESGSASDSDYDAQPGVGRQARSWRVQAGLGAPILSLELLECPNVTAEHVRMLRESVDDVRWKSYTPGGG